MFHKKRTNLLFKKLSLLGRHGKCPRCGCDRQQQEQQPREGWLPSYVTLQQAKL